MVWETGVQSQVKSYQRLKKWYLMPPSLTHSIIRYGSRIKWNNPGKGVAPFPTPQCNSYWKGRLWVALDLLLQIFKTIEKLEFHVLIKHCFLMGKILFKQSNGLVSAIWILLRQKQQLRDGMLTLNVVVKTQMMLNVQVAQIRQLQLFQSNKEKFFA